MKCRKAKVSDATTITNIVQVTREIVYPRFYPALVVSFFESLHSYNNVLYDINNNNVYVIEVNGLIVGTGSFKENHLTRLYILPEYQNQHYGSYLLQKLEDMIFKSYDSIILEASLPACIFYEKKGYKVKNHEQYNCGSEAVLIYDVMEKVASIY